MPKLSVTVTWGRDASAEATGGVSPLPPPEGDTFLLVDIRNGHIGVVHESPHAAIRAGEYALRTEHVRTYGVRKIVTRKLLMLIDPDAICAWDEQRGRLLSG